MTTGASSTPYLRQDACGLTSLESGLPAANSLTLLIVVSQMVEIASRVKNASYRRVDIVPALL